MRPALSVIFFTVASGAGLGVLALLALADVTGIAAAWTDRTVLASLIAGFLLVSAGLVSSTLHLANPKNAWRAVTQFRRSWLSREAVFALGLYVPLLAYAVIVLGDGPRAARTAAAILMGVLALATLYCTGMIYACLKTIRQWNSRLVPLAYLTLGLYSGGLVLFAIAAAGSPTADGLAVMVLALMAAAALVKGAYYVKFRGPADQLPLAAALGFDRTTRLLDVGHTHGNFLTHEFYFRIARDRALLLRYLALALAFVVPLGVFTLGPGGPMVTTLAVAANLSGLLVERWLFFAEAEHVVRLYHGQASVRQPMRTAAPRTSRS